MFAAFAKLSFTHPILSKQQLLYKTVRSFSVIEDKLSLIDLFGDNDDGDEYDHNGIKLPPFGSLISFTTQRQYNIGIYEGTKICTFEEFLKLCKMSGIKAYVEPKSTITSDNIDSVLSLIKSSGMINNTTILSDINTLTLFSNKTKKLRLAYSGGIYQDNIEKLKALGNEVIYDTGFLYNNYDDETIKLVPFKKEER